MNHLPRLMDLIDSATDREWDDEQRAIYACAPGDWELRVQANQERIGDALAAIVLLLLRNDVLALEQWREY